jgi:tetratricopeptide (TPR) repeat protein
MVIIVIIINIFSNEPNAEDICERSLYEALKFDPNSFDALIQMSNLRILRKRDAEALIYMDRIYNSVLEYINLGDETLLPPQEILANLSKNYSEISQYVKAIKILDIILKLNDEDLECWYLLAFNHFTIKNYKYSMKCLKNFKRVYDKHSYKSDEMIELEEAATELYHTLENIRKNTQDGELRNNNIEESEEKDEEERIMDNSNADMNIDY